MLKLIIAGSRTFKCYEIVQRATDEIIEKLKKSGYNCDEVEIVSGTATGADHLGELYAVRNGFHVKMFPADWNEYGNKAGPIRNGVMAKYADACIVFWDGKSRGSKSMIELAKERKIPCYIITMTYKIEAV